MALIISDVTMVFIPVWPQPQIFLLVNFKKLCLTDFSIGNVWVKVRTHVCFYFLGTSKHFFHKYFWCLLSFKAISYSHKFVRYEILVFFADNCSTTKV